MTLRAIMLTRLFRLAAKPCHSWQLGKGNDYWFSATGRSAIAYRVSYGIALTVTGPFGDPREYAEDLTDFATFCAQHSWTPVFYSVHESREPNSAKAGWDSLDVGTEMIVNPNEWQTRGKKWQDVRPPQQSQTRRHHRRAHHFQGSTLLSANANS